MSAPSGPEPRARLFEYLRHAHIGDSTIRHLAAEENARVAGLAEVFQMDLALRSWHQAEPVLKIRSAPEPRGHHEFFRAVRP